MRELGDAAFDSVLWFVNTSTPKRVTYPKLAFPWRVGKWEHATKSGKNKVRANEQDEGGRNREGERQLGTGQKGQDSIGGRCT